MPSFLSAETFKYLYLTFEEDLGGAAQPALNLRDWAFTTEAHPLRRPPRPVDFVVDLAIGI
jgi:Glycosyl hydrolase family 47